ncbi:MAG: GxxExxY protein [Spirochaetales bacterium]|nr:GxxExxY protein [Spirochaetales bacterium]
MLYEKLSYEVIGSCIRVHKEIGPGLLEQCYHNAPIRYCIRGRWSESIWQTGSDNMVILELKAVKALDNAHMAQLINYLHISGCRVGYLVIFQRPKLEFKRLVV